MKGLIFLDAAEQLSPEYLGTPGQPGKLADQLTTTAQFLKKQKLIDRRARRRASSTRPWTRRSSRRPAGS